MAPRWPLHSCKYHINLATNADLHRVKNQPVGFWANCFTYCICKKTNKLKSLTLPLVCCANGRFKLRWVRSVIMGEVAAVCFPPTCFLAKENRPVNSEPVRQKVRPGRRKAQNKQTNQSYFWVTPSLPHKALHTWAATVGLKKKSNINMCYTLKASREWLGLLKVLSKCFVEQQATVIHLKMQFVFFSCL